jgi:hypothetical protein
MRGRDLARFLYGRLTLNEVFVSKPAAGVVDEIIARIADAGAAGHISAEDRNALHGEWSGFRQLLGSCTQPFVWLFGQKSAQGTDCSETLWDSLTSYSFAHTIRLGMHVPFTSKAYLVRAYAPSAIQDLVDPALPLRGYTYDDLFKRKKEANLVMPMSRARQTGVFGMPPGTLPSLEGEDKGNYRVCNCNTGANACLFNQNPQYWCEIGEDGHCKLGSDCEP